MSRNQENGAIAKNTVKYLTLRGQRYKKRHPQEAG